jgi:hypothetical protein
MYGVHPLTAADADTIEVKTIKGVTYVPIPQGTGEWYAGLFTVDMPQTVTTGQEFDIVVRRIGKRPVRVSTYPPPPPPPPPNPQVISRRRPGGTIDHPVPALCLVPRNGLVGPPAHAGSAELRAAPPLTSPVRQ